jgi:hypothetical protein
MAKLFGSGDRTSIGIHIGPDNAFLNTGDTYDSDMHCNQLMYTHVKSYMSSADKLFNHLRARNRE